MDNKQIERESRELIGRIFELLSNVFFLATMLIVNIHPRQDIIDWGMKKRKKDHHYPAKYNDQDEIGDIITYEFSETNIILFLKELSEVSKFKKEIEAILPALTKCMGKDSLRNDFAHARIFRGAVIYRPVYENGAFKNSKNFENLCAEKDGLPSVENKNTDMFMHDLETICTYLNGLFNLIAKKSAKMQLPDLNYQSPIFKTA